MLTQADKEEIADAVVAVLKNIFAERDKQHRDLATRVGVLELREHGANKRVMKLEGRQSRLIKVDQLDDAERPPHAAGARVLDGERLVPTLDDAADVIQAMLDDHQGRFAAE